jgi:hypothetical protein
LRATRDGEGLPEVAPGPEEGSAGTIQQLGQVIQRAEVLRQK